VWVLLASALILAVLVWAIALRDGGGAIPGDAVASVDGSSITRADYAKWALISARGSQGAAAVVPDPPTFTRCIAELRAKSRPARGQPKPTDVTLRAQCRQQNETLVQQTMGTLIQNLWIEKEAEEQGVTVTDADVKRQLAATKRQSFRNEAAFQRFLRQSGMTEDDVLERVRIQAFASALTRKIQTSLSPVTDAQIQSYYRRNKRQFGEGSSLAKARAQIRALLEQQGQQTKLATFVRDFQDRWRAKTDCREGYVVELCSNAPKPKAAAPAAPAGAPVSPAVPQPGAPAGQ